MDMENVALQGYSTMLYEDLIGLCNFRCYSKENLKLNNDSHEDCMKLCSKNEVSNLEFFARYMQARNEKQFRG